MTGSAEVDGIDRGERCRIEDACRISLICIFAACRVALNFIHPVDVLPAGAVAGFAAETGDGVQR